jgi:hypothetical protein
MRLTVSAVPVVCLLLLACPAAAIGGESIVLSTAMVGNSQVPAQAVNGACRVEVSFHDWDPPPMFSHPWDAPACGVDFTIYNIGNGVILLAIYSSHNTGEQGNGCLIPLGVDANGAAVLPSKFATVRFQRVPNGLGGVDECEATDINGRTFWSENEVYTGTKGVFSPGVTVGGTEQTISTAYFRLFTTTVPMGSRPPVTADKGDLLEWKFDGDLSDSSGHGYGAIFLNGYPFYVPTPGQDLVIAVVKTANAPTWSPWVSMRAGYPNQLDCSDSYSQADASAAVTCQWTLVNGPSAVGWSSQSAAQTTLTNVVFGTYQFSLQVTDATGNTATGTLDVGAVAYDDNGVVIPADPKVTEIFGPMIAFGQNPWGYEDERNKRAVELQNAYYLKQGLDHPTWATSGEGTVSYPFGGIGVGYGQSGTTLSETITGTGMSIPIADAGMIPGLASLPTWIWIGNWFYQQELVRVCSTTGTSGAAILGVCYDGRGLTAAEGTFIGAQGWNAGTVVGEYRVQGSGTKFVTDAKTAICPAGAPGPPGAVVYSTGTVTLSAGSTTIAGNGTSWTTANNVIAAYFIRVEATHGGGTPFVYWATITSVNNPTQVTVSRALPGDVDAGPFPYKVTSYRYISLHFTAPDGSDENLLQYTAGCESETAVFANVAHDISALNRNWYTGVSYSYKDSLGIQSAFGPNFYGSGLAARAFYLRSGWDFAKQTADIMDERWVRDPEIAAGWLGGIPLLQGGGVVGAFADLVTNPTTGLTWSDVRRFALSGSIGNSGCNDWDTRDSGYLGAYVALAANFDPDQTMRGEWKSQLAALYNRDVRCKQADNSWSNGFLFNSSASPALSMTNGSATVTGIGIPPSLCYGIASGAVTVANGSATINGTGLVDGNKIVITGTRQGSTYEGMFRFTQSGGTSGTLGVLWPGDSGTFPYVIENNDDLTTIGTSSDDPQLSKNWACTWNSDSQITLNRPWDGPSESNAVLFSYVLSGFGQQPFMLGVKMTYMKFGSQIDDLGLAASYEQLVSLAATWIHNVGYDPVTQGMNYGRVFEACEPLTVPAPGSTFDSRMPGCNYGLNPASIRTARVLTAETTQALRSYYESFPSSMRKEWGDRAYGSIWGYCPYTKPGFYCDDNYVRDENSDASLAAYKWPGYFFGMGMSHQWPAVRVSVAPLRTLER